MYSSFCLPSSLSFLLFFSLYLFLFIQPFIFLPISSLLPCLFPLSFFYFFPPFCDHWVVRHSQVHPFYFSSHTLIFCKLDLARVTTTCVQLAAFHSVALLKFTRYTEIPLATECVSSFLHVKPLSPVIFNATCPFNRLSFHIFHQGMLIISREVRFKIVPRIKVCCKYIYHFPAYPSFFYSVFVAQVYYAAAEAIFNGVSFILISPLRTSLVFLLLFVWRWFMHVLGCFYLQRVFPVPLLVPLSLRGREKKDRREDIRTDRLTGIGRRAFIKRDGQNGH